jgi:hypothetical protein
MATPEENLQRFRSLIGEQSAAPTNQGGVNAPPVVEATGVTQPENALQRFRELTLPMSQNAVNQVRGVEAVPSLTATQREGRRSASGELIPISNEGLGSRYWRIAMQRGPEAQMALLSKLYPDSKPRILESGAIGVELIDSATGKPKEVIVNPVGIEPHDLIDLAVQMPEIAAGTAVAIMTQGRGFLKTAAQIVLSSLASSGAGALKDISARSSEGIDVRLGEIATSRTGEAALDMFLQTSLLGGAKAFRAFSPFSKDIKPETLEFDMARAQDFFQREFGENFPATPAEVTGSPALQAIEAVETPQPGARTVMQKLRERRQEVVRRIQDRAIGRTTTDEAMGEESLNVLRQRVVLPVEDALNTARAAAEQKSNKRLGQIIDDLTLPASDRVTPTMAGAKTLEEFEGKLSQAQAKVDAAYAEVNKLPGGSGDVLDGSATAAAAADIRKELPKVTRGGSTEVLTSGVPEGLLKALNDMESLAGAKVSLQTLTNMKRAAYDEIAKTEAVPGVKERWFNKVAKAYEKGIEDGIQQTGNPQLKAALTNAKEVYKKELLPFDRPGLKELAKGEFDAARLSPEQVANRLFEGPKAIENFRMLKETLGADNPAFRVLKRSWMDSQLADVTDPISGSIDAKALSDRFLKLSKDRPELANEMFGNKFPEIIADLRFMDAWKNLKSLDEVEIKTLMGLKHPSRADLENILKLQQNRDTVYANSIIADVADGVINTKGLKPTEFVKRISNARTPTKDVEQVLEVLARESPETRRAIATVTLYKLLNEATTSEAATGAKALKPGALNISPTRLKEAIGRAGTDERKRIELLLGDEALAIVPGQKGPTRGEVLENLVALLSPSQVKSQTMGAAGGIAGGMQVLGLLRDPIKYATSYAQKLAMATVWTDKAFTKIISNRVFSPAETAVLANTMIASEPFLRRIYEVTGDETIAGTVVNELKDSIDRFVAEIAESPQGREVAEIRKLARGEAASVKLQAR